MSRLLEQAAWSVGTGQLKALVVVEPPHCEAVWPAARHCALVR